MGGLKPDRYSLMWDKRWRLPDGRVGKVHLIERDIRDGEVAVSIMPEGAKRRLLGILDPKPVRLVDEQIDLLMEAHSDEEIQAILDDPETLGLDP